MTKQSATLFVLLLAGTTNSAIASDNSPSKDEIIVTGARTPVAISKIANAVTVIDRDDIDRRQPRYVSDLLRSVPGVSVSHTGTTGSQTQVRVRGAEANHVLVLIDGVRANDPATGDEFRWEYLSTADIERVEVVRGPQSALWGSDAVAAVVHIITRTGEGRSGGRAYAESGSNGTLNLGANGVLSNGNWLLRAGIEALDTDGENISRNGDEKDAANVTTASIAATWNSERDTTVKLGLRALDAESNTDPVDFFVTGLPVDGDQLTRSNGIIANASVDWLTNNDRIQYRAGAVIHDTEHDNLVDGTAASSTASERITLALQSNIRFGANVLSLALEHEDTEFQQRGAVVFGDPNQDQAMQTTSAIVEYQHLSDERLSWILGGRFDNHSDFEDVVTGRAALSFLLTDNTKLRASVGTAHKTPTFTERFGFFPAQFSGNPNLDPETSTSLDLGIDQSLLDGAMHLSMTVFAQQLKDEINGFVFDPVLFVATAENRANDSDRSGIELSGNWQLADNLGLAASYTYTDTTEEDAQGRDQRELRRPRHGGSVAIDYLSDDQRLGINLHADMNGERNDIFFAPFPEPPSSVALDSHVLLDLTIQFRMTPALTMFVRGTNLLDDEYEQVYGYRTLGRSTYIGIRTNFGQ